MQLRAGWAVLGALALGAALAWWMTHREDQGLRPLTAAPAKAHTEARGRGAASGADTLYRWVDAHGVVNVSNIRPPAGTRYSTVHIDPNQNVVPMGATVDPSQKPTGSH